MIYIDILYIIYNENTVQKYFIAVCLMYNELYKKLVNRFWVVNRVLVGGVIRFFYTDFLNNCSLPKKS